MEPSHEDMHIDPTAVVTDDDDEDDDGEDVDIAAGGGPSRASPSFFSMLERVLETQSSQHIMMEIFMTTQAAYEQLLDSFISDVAALRADFSKCRSSFPPPTPSDD